MDESPSATQDAPHRTSLRSARPDTVWKSENTKVRKYLTMVHRTGTRAVLLGSSTLAIHATPSLQTHSHSHPSPKCCTVKHALGGGGGVSARRRQPHRFSGEGKAGAPPFPPSRVPLAHILAQHPSFVHALRRKYFVQSLSCFLLLTAACRNHADRILTLIDLSLFAFCLIR